MPTGEGEEGGRGKKESFVALALGRCRIRRLRQLRLCTVCSVASGASLRSRGAVPVARQRLDSTPQRTLGRFLAGAPLARHCRENPETRDCHHHDEMHPYRCYSTVPAGGLFISCGFVLMLTYFLQMRPHCCSSQGFALRRSPANFHPHDPWSTRSRSPL